MYSLRRYKNNLNPALCIGRCAIFPYEQQQAPINANIMTNSLANNESNYARKNGKKERICTTFTQNSIDAIHAFKSARGFLNEQDAIRFIVNAVLTKEGYLKP